MDGRRDRSEATALTAAAAAAAAAARRVMIDGRGFRGGAERGGRGTGDGVAERNLASSCSSAAMRFFASRSCSAGDGEGEGYISERGGRWMCDKNSTDGKRKYEGWGSGSAGTKTRGEVRAGHKPSEYQESADTLKIGAYFERGVVVAWAIDTRVA